MPEEVKGMKNVTVFGAGNGGVTAAYHFAREGYRVCICDVPAFPVQIAHIAACGGISAAKEAHGCSMMLDGFAPVELATCDMKAAMEFSQLYVIVCPSFAQEIFFAQMIPHLKDGSVIVTMPANYAGLVFTEMLRKAGKADLAVHFVDTISIPWACRLLSPGVTSIMGLKTFLPLSIYPTDESGATEQKIRDLLPIPVEILKNPLVAGLENINFGGHPLMTTINIGLLENFGGNFNYYKDCCSPATAKAAAKMDLERLAVGKALGFTLRTELEAMNALYGMKEESVYDFNRKSVSHGKIGSAPNSAKARYISEDVPYVLVPCYELAKLCGVDTPLIRACITLASAYNEENYFESGRTLLAMGLSDLSAEEIKRKFSE